MRPPLTAETKRKTYTPTEQANAHRLKGCKRHADLETWGRVYHWFISKGVRHAVLAAYFGDAPRTIRRAVDAYGASKRKGRQDRWAGKHWPSTPERDRTVAYLATKAPLVLNHLLSFNPKVVTQAPKARAAYLLRQEGKSLGQIAEAMKISRTTVQGHLRIWTAEREATYTTAVEAPRNGSAPTLPEQMYQSLAEAMGVPKHVRGGQAKGLPKGQKAEKPAQKKRITHLDLLAAQDAHVSDASDRTEGPVLVPHLHFRDQVICSDSHCRQPHWHVYSDRSALSDCSDCSSDWYRGVGVSA